MKYAFGLLLAAAVGCGTPSAPKGTPVTPPEGVATASSTAAPMAAPSSTAPSTVAPATVALEDGLYLVAGDGPSAAAGPGQVLVDYDVPHLPGEPGEHERLVLEGRPVVAMALALPSKTDFTPGQCGNVSFQFAPEAAESFADATGDNLGRRMAIVLDGRVVTAHKIRERIEGGRVMITCCNPEACARLQEVLAPRVQPAGVP